MICDIKSLVKRVVVVLSFAYIPALVAGHESDDRFLPPAPPAAWSDGESVQERVTTRIRALRATGVEYDFEDDTWPAIAYAVNNRKSNKRDRVANLLREGADPNWQTKKGFTLLAMATRDEDVEVARLLVDAKADLDGNYIEGSTMAATRGDWNGETVLMQAAQAGSLELVNVFIGAGASVNRRDICRRTALNRGVSSGNPAVVQALLAAGAIVRTEDMETVERAAGRTGNHDIIALLRNAPVWQRSYILLAKQARASQHFTTVLALLTCAAAGALVLHQ